MQLKFGHYEAVEDGSPSVSRARSSSVVSSVGPVEEFTERRTVQLKFVGRLLFFAMVCVGLGFAVISLDGVLYQGRLFGLGSTSLETATTYKETYRFTYSTMSDTEQTALFDDFVSHFGKTYSSDSDEYATRLSNFKITLQVIDERNQEEALTQGDGVHGITKFADLSQEEFEAAYLLEFYEEDEYAGTDADDHARVRGRGRGRGRRTEARPMTAAAATPPRRKTQETTDSTATLIDWSTSLTTAVNDQGTGCRGASWAFTAAQQIESDAIRKGYLTVNDALSAQQFLDCNTESNGCTSGSLESAYDYASKSNGGLLHWASQYPFVNSDGECASADSDYATTLGSYATVTKYHNEEYGYTTTQVESNMLAHLAATGTLSACMDGSTWNTYVSGTLSACVGNTINTCAQIVGVYYDPVSDSGYYKVRNSWGTDWGEAGFIRLAHGVNSCNIVYNPGYTDPASSLSRLR